MKEMLYSSERKNEILDTGFCFGLLYYILNLGTHPTAYKKYQRIIGYMARVKAKYMKKLILIQIY